MIGLLTTTLIEYTPSPLREKLSSIFGSISFSCWIILMIPQLVEQWRLKTVDGISPIFLIIWSIGDILNFIGSIWAGLLPEVILIASWFLFADIFTFAFYLYIKIVYDKKRIDKIVIIEQGYGAVNDEEHGENQHHEHQHQHHHHHHHHHERRRSSTLEDVVYEPENHSIFIKYILPIILVISSGIFGSILSPNSNNSTKILTSSTNSYNVPQILGYCSAFLYLTARLPQIYHNYQKKSTKGLSLLFFLFTMLGNITYSLQIVSYRNDYDYLMLNMSWLLGSFGTILEDIIIILQFYFYREIEN